VLSRVELAPLDSRFVEELSSGPVVDLEAGLPQPVGQVVAVDPDVVLLPKATIRSSGDLIEGSS
jgi:hypothetical protein